VLQWEVDGNGSGSCEMTDFGDSGDKLSDSVITESRDPTKTILKIN
jgi:hypothetical protein